MPGKILGLDITENMIAAVQVTGSLKGYQVTAWAHAPVESEEGLEPAIQDVISRIELKSDICHTALPAGLVSFRNLSLPFKDNKKIKQTLPFEMESMLPLSIDDMVVDHILIDRSEQSRVLAASVNKAIVDNHLKRLKEHGIDPDAVDVRGLPIVQWLMSEEAAPANGIFLQIDPLRVAMVLFLERHIVLVRTFFRGESAGRTLNPLLKEIRNTIHSYHVKQDGMAPTPIEVVFFSETGPAEFDTAGLLNRFFDVPAEKIDITRYGKIGMSEALAGAWDPSLMNNALALALRETRTGLGFNFRKNEFEKKRQYLGSVKELRRAAVFLAVLLFLTAVNMGANFYALKKRNDILDREIAEVFKTTFPEVTRVVAPVEQMRAKLKEVKESLINNPEINLDETILDLLKEVSQKVPDSVELRITRMVVDSESIRISGLTDTYETVDKIKSALESSPRFSSVKISSAKQDRTGEKIEFESMLKRNVKE